MLWNEIDISGAHSNVYSHNALHHTPIMHCIVLPQCIELHSQNALHYTLGKKCNSQVTAKNYIDIELIIHNNHFELTMVIPRIHIEHILIINNTCIELIPITHRSKLDLIFLIYRFCIELIYSSLTKPILDSSLILPSTTIELMMIHHIGFDVMISSHLFFILLDGVVLVWSFSTNFFQFYCIQAKCF